MLKQLAVPDYVKTALDILAKHGFEAYLVGGCIRDMLLGVEPTDYDISTNALPDQIKDTFSQYQTIDTGIRHGTVTLIINREQLEITTYRIDGKYNDGRHPESVKFASDIQEDLSRRDFTMNSLAYSIHEGVLDPFGGAEDIRLGIIACVGNPHKRFSEDALRILRALRFASRLKFKIHPQTQAGIHDMLNNLEKISLERIQKELNGILLGDGVNEILSEYTDVILKIIPELEASVGFNQHSRYHKYDVWMHSINAVSSSPKELCIRLAMLLHDCGKPYCFKLDKDGNGHFPNHDEISGDMAYSVLKRLKYSKKITNEAVMLIKNHTIPTESETDIRRALAKLGADTFFKLLDVQRADAMSKHDFCIKRLPELDMSQKKAERMLSEKVCLKTADLAVNGYDMLTLGLQGKAIGDALNYLLNNIINGTIDNDYKTLIEFVKRKYKIS